MNREQEKAMFAKNGDKPSALSSKDIIQNIASEDSVSKSFREALGVKKNELKLSPDENRELKEKNPDAFFIFENIKKHTDNVINARTALAGSITNSLVAIDHVRSVIDSKEKEEDLTVEEIMKLQEKNKGLNRMFDAQEEGARQANQAFNHVAKAIFVQLRANRVARDIIQGG